MREVFLFLLLLLSSCLGVSTAVVPPSGSEPPTPITPTLGPPPMLTKEFLIVEDVDALVLESYPMQLRLAVRGYWPSGCSGDVRVEQALEGDTLTVRIWRGMVVGAVCPAVIVPYYETIAIEGGFTQLPAEIVVNGYTVRPNP
jgi:hypothetical protein